jgi:hypothetical protein
METGRLVKGSVKPTEDRRRPTRTLAEEGGWLDPERGSPVSVLGEIAIFGVPVAVLSKGRLAGLGVE